MTVSRKQWSIKECIDTSLTLHNHKSLWKIFKAEKHACFSYSSCRLVRFANSVGRTPVRLRPFN